MTTDYVDLNMLSSERNKVRKDIRHQIAHIPEFQSSNNVQVLILKS